jgi:hypothetical protein
MDPTTIPARNCMPDMKSVRGQKAAFLNTSFLPFPNLPEFSTSNFARSSFCRANALTTRTPVRFSCRVVVSLASCS